MGVAHVQQWAIVRADKDRYIILHQSKGLPVQHELLIHEYIFTMSRQNLKLYFKSLSKIQTNYMYTNCAYIGKPWERLSTVHIGR